MSVGHAGESRDTIENTKNWLLEVKPEEFDCTVITTYPGSPYFDDAVRKNDGTYVYTCGSSGDKLYQSQIDYLSELDYYKGDPEGGYISYVWTDHLSPSEIVECRDNLESEVRKSLKIPFNPTRPGIKYEHSMGMGNTILPDFILRKTK